MKVLSRNLTTEWVLLFAALSWAIPASLAQAATLTVSSLGNAGPGTLRQAILDAAPGDTIDFGVQGTISLTGGELAITDDLTIDGPGTGLMEVSAAGDGRVFDVTGGGTVSISGLVIRDGAAAQGGAIRNAATLIVRECHLLDNVANLNGGAVHNSGTFSLVDSDVSQNLVGSAGGGLYNGPNATMRMIRSTLRHNDAPNGGGIFNDGNLLVINSTISGNTAGGNGGGVWAGGFTQLVHTTITENQAGIAGGVRVEGDVRSSSSMVANNLGTPECWGPEAVTSLGFNLDRDNSCGFSAATDLPSTTPNLGPLGDNGGPTLTHELFAGQPAVDHIPAASCVVSEDQRGVFRPQGDRCDIGAFEVGRLCSADVDASYFQGVLSLDFTVGTSQSGTAWSVWMFIPGSQISLFNIDLPILEPELSVPLAFPFPNIGNIGVLSLITGAGGIQCADFDIVNTSVPIVR